MEGEGVQGQSRCQSPTALREEAEAEAGAERVGKEKMNHLMRSHMIFFVAVSWSNLKIETGSMDSIPCPFFDISSSRVEFLSTLFHWV